MSFTAKPLNALDVLSMVSLLAVGPLRALWVWDAAGALDSSACPSDREPHVRASERCADVPAGATGGYSENVDLECAERSAKSLIRRGQIPLASRVVAVASERLTPLAPERLG